MSDDVRYMPNLSERFLAVLRPSKRQPKHAIDDQEYGAFLMRAIRGWEARVISNPEMLKQNEKIVERIREITNVAIASNAERYAVDPASGASMLECARILGIGKATVSERRGNGMKIMADRVGRAGAVRFSEAQRERELLTEARQEAVAYLDDYRARHAS